MVCDVCVHGDIMGIITVRQAMVCENSVHFSKTRLP